jgi:hypothetical protein
MIKKIKSILLKVWQLLNKPLFETHRYCKYCKWHIPKWYEDGQVVEEHVCGETLQTYVNEIGQTLLKTYGDIQRCEMCGHIEKDGRDIRYQKCIIRNKEFNCKVFKKKWYLFLLTDKPKAAGKGN